MDSDYDDDIADDDLVAAASRLSAPVRQVATDQGSPQSPPGPSIGSLRNKADSFAASRAPAANRAGPRAESDPQVELEDIPSDALSSGDDGDDIASRAPPAVNRNGPSSRGGRALPWRTSPKRIQQTNLFGERIDFSEPVPSQIVGRPYRIDIPTHATHHELDHEALKTWVYPTNLGAIRSYQYSIVHASLFQNTLVALPTGLGKTFIAATVMLNFYRWTKKAKIVFVAPTKPLASQQVDACFHVAGIPRSDTTLLTGETPPALRDDEWREKRVFFMTPQTLLNDLSHGGYLHPKEIALLVVDEAHRATGSYAYASVVKLMRPLNPSFRVLALTATPGSKVETVQEVIDNLGISHVEIRTEESLDIRQYVHSRDIEQVVLDPSDEILEIQELLRKALKPLVDKLSQQNIYTQRDPMHYTLFGLRMAHEEWARTAGRHVNEAVKGMMRAVFQTLQSVAHAIKLLNFHGIRPFYDNVKPFRDEVEARGEKGSKYRWNLVRDRNFQDMMANIERWLRVDDFVGHPKMAELSSRVLNHFMDRETDSKTRVIVFVEYRDSAEEIVRVLNRQRPLIRATVFVGQAKSRNSEGMAQRQQIETIRQFKDGEFNVLVATSIGEEGLDIGQVDLVICYDASGSPIRMLQRMGRTGRKKAGNIVLLLMRGKEEEAFAKSKDNYYQMQRLISEKTKFNFRHDLSARIVPREVQPEVDQRHVEIPIENTQTTGLPEPKRRKPPGKKKPPKKFHMPDGVETGFTRASNLDGFMIKGSGRSGKKAAPPLRREEDELADIPVLDGVLLTQSQENEFSRAYRNIPKRRDGGEYEEIPDLDLGRFPSLQRRLRPTGKFGHGAHTKRYVGMLGRLGQMQEPDAVVYNPDDDFIDMDYTDLPMPSFATDSDESSEEVQTIHITAKSGKRPRAAVTSINISEEEEEEETSRRKRQKSAVSKGPRLRPPRIAFVDEFLSDEDDDLMNATPEGDEEEEDDEGDEPSLPKARQGSNTTKPRSKPAGRKRKPAALKRGRLGIGSSEIGDACDRTSDVESDGDGGDDDGADLLDFIVSDGEPIPSGETSSTPASSPATLRRDRRSTSPTSDMGPFLSSPPPHHASKTSKGAVASRAAVAGTQGSDDESLPALSQLLKDKNKIRGGAGHGKHRAVASSNEEKDGSPRSRPKRGRRTVIMDDSEDEL